MKRLYMTPALKAVAMEHEEMIANSIEGTITLPDGTFADKGSHVEAGDDHEDENGKIYGDVKKSLWDDMW